MSGADPGNTPSDPRRLVGSAGEEEAVSFLRQQGYRILERNFRLRGGEVDIIAQDGETIVFVEVKTRRSLSFGPPELSVTQAKQRRIITAARWWLQRHALENSPARFDVVAITIANGASTRELIRDAFQLP